MDEIMEVRAERIAMMVEDFRRHLPVNQLSEKRLETFAEYILQGYIHPHESVYVDDRRKIESLQSKLRVAEKALKKIAKDGEACYLATWAREALAQLRRG